MQPIYYYIIYSLAGLLLILFIIILLRYFKSRKPKNIGQKIEEQIDRNTNLEILLKQINRFSRENDYRSAIIYLFFLLRLQGEKKYTIRNGRNIAYQKFLFLLRGIPEINLSEIDDITKLYEKVRFTSNAVTFNEFIMMRKIVEKIIKNE